MIKRSRSFWQSLGFAADGIFYSFRTQRNIRIHSFFALVILLAAGYFHISRMEILILLITIVGVISLEIVNTAVETVVDLYTEEFLPLAKIAKNVAAGAVLLASLGAVIVGLMIFGPRIVQLFLYLIH